MLELNLDQIKRCLDFHDAVNRITDAYTKSSLNEVQTGEVVHLAFEESRGDCHIKSGHINGTENFVVKIASGFYDNPSKGLPSSNGMMLAFSATTGAAVAILKDEGWLTDLRTGIGGAIATRTLAASGENEALIIGTGIQARMQATCLAELDAEREMSFSIWGRDQAKAETLAGELSDQGIKAASVGDLEQAVRSARIIITTTPSAEALFEVDWVQPGTHVTAMGADSPGKQELPVELVHKADLRVCDMARQSLQHGEFQHAASENPDLDAIELGQVLSGSHPGRSSDDAITIADLTGIAAQDIAITQAVIDSVQSNSNQKDQS